MHRRIGDDVFFEAMGISFSRMALLGKQNATSHHRFNRIPARLPFCLSATT
jgi:hypothetical protein